MAVTPSPLAFLPITGGTITGPLTITGGGITSAQGIVIQSGNLSVSLGNVNAPLGNMSANGPYTATAGGIASSGNADVTTVGNGYQVKEGTNAKQGVTAALVAGTLTVANTSVTASSRIFLTGQTAGGTPGGLNVSARTAGTSFTITSTNAADTSTAGFEIFEPG